MTFGADDAGPESASAVAVPSELEDSVSLEMNNGEGGAYGWLRISMLVMIPSMLGR